MRRSLPLLLLLSACADTGESGAPDEPAALVAALHAEPLTTFVGQSVRFDASESIDRQGIGAGFSDSAISEFRFDFGDGGWFVQDSFWIQHTYVDAGTYAATVTITEGEEEATAGVEVVVRHPPPSVLSLDVSADGKAVIGEWVVLEGRGFREANVPTVRFESVAAEHVAFLNEFQWAIQVPPATPSGLVEVRVDFPEEDEGDWTDEIRVARYALATDAWRGRANIIEFGDHEQAWPLSQTLELDAAAVVAISADGSFALLGDARFQAALNPTIALVDMTADWGPAVTAQLPDAGEGPLHGIALARDVPTAVVTDLTGFTVLDLSDPADPVIVDREDYQFSEMSPTAIALSPDGTRLAVLSTWNDRLRFYSITAGGIVYDDDSVDVGPGTQGLAQHPDDSLLYVLGGGGIGAIPPDLDFGNTSITVVDFDGNHAEDIHGGWIPIPNTPIPVDIAVGPSGKAWVTTLDQNFGTLGQAFTDITANPADIGAWQDLVGSISNLGFGAAVGIDGLEAGTPVLDEGLFTDFGFQAGIDVRFDERAYVSTVIAIGTTLEILSDDSLLHLSLDIDYAVAVCDLVSGEVTAYPMFTAPVVSYIDFQLNYDLGPLIDLLLPPYAFGDVAIQP
jgi:DNA-binding beta-propeller fold protein YncE